MKDMPTWLKRILIVLMCAVLFIVIAAGAVFAIFYSQLKKIPKVDEDTLDWISPESEFFDTDIPDTDDYFETETDETDEHGNVITDTETTAPPEYNPDDIVIKPVDPIVSDGLVNILLVGQDKRPGEGRQRSDTMILVSINAKTKEVSLISFLRDMYVSIPGGYSNNRLNVAYVYGGFSCLNQTLYENFGVNVDYNIEVDFTAFVEIIDLVGGVDIELTKKEAKYMVKQMNCDVLEGINRLNGKEALSYCRIRKIDSDFGRTERQRKVLLAILDEAKKKPVDELFDLVDAVCPYLTTDMSNMEILTLAAQLIPTLSSLNVGTYHVPEYGTFEAATIRKMSVLVPDTAKIRDLLATKYLPLD